MTYVSAQRRGRADRAQFATQLRRVANDHQVVLVRGRRVNTEGGSWVIHAYDAGFSRVPLTAAAVTELGHLLEATRPDLAWARPHDYHLDTGMWRASPLGNEPGAVPADDKQFGGTTPEFLPYTITPAVAAPAGRERAA